MDGMCLLIDNRMVPLIATPSTPDGRSWGLWTKGWILLPLRVAVPALKHPSFVGRGDDGRFGRDTQTSMVMDLPVEKAAISA
jgi:hypothetical protein